MDSEHTPMVRSGGRGKPFRATVVALLAVLAAGSASQPYPGPPSSNE